MNKIKKIIGRQIIDSRGNPTCEADVILENGIVGEVQSHQEHPLENWRLWS